MSAAKGERPGDEERTAGRADEDPQIAPHGAQLSGMEIFGGFGDGPHKRILTAKSIACRFDALLARYCEPWEPMERAGPENSPFPENWCAPTRHREGDLRPLWTERGNTRVFPGKSK